MTFSLTSVSTGAASGPSEDTGFFAAREIGPDFRASVRHNPAVNEKTFTENEAPEASIVVAPPVTKGKAVEKLRAMKLADAATKALVQSVDPLPLGELTTVALSEIFVEGRFRKDLGDIKALGRSMAESGLAQPPIVDAAMRLVCGYRRYKAAESLGWKEMTVRVLDIEDPLALMVAEDAARKDLTSSEKYAICETLRGRAQEEAWRKRAFGGRLEEASRKGRLDEEIGKALRLSRETLRKIRAIHQATQDDATKFGDLVSKLDEDGRVDRHYRELERRQSRGDASRATAIVAMPGWARLLDDTEAKEFAKTAKARVLALGTEEGTALLLPSSVATLGEAAGLLRQCNFEWRATLRGSGATEEDLWLVGVCGRKSTIPIEVLEVLAEGCAKGAGDVIEATQVALDDVKVLDLGAG